MKDLTTFNRFGDSFKQLKKTGPIALYKRSKPGRFDMFEVVILKPMVSSKINGNVIKSKEENYPATTAWGRLGWTHIDKELAEKQFDTLVKTECDVKETIENVEMEDINVVVAEPVTETVVETPILEKVKKVKIVKTFVLKKKTPGKKIDKAELKFPNDQWTLKQAHALNPTCCHATVWTYVKKMVVAGKMVVCGDLKLGKGKPTLLYRMAGPDDIKQPEPVKVPDNTPF